MGCKFSPAIKRTDARNFSSAKTRHLCRFSIFFAVFVKTVNTQTYFCAQKKQQKHKLLAHRGVGESSQELSEMQQNVLQVSECTVSILCNHNHYRIMKIHQAKQICHINPENLFEENFQRCKFLPYTANKIREMKLCGLFSNFHIHIFFSDLYILILQEPFKDSATSPTARILTCDTTLSTAFFLLHTALCNDAKNKLRSCCQQRNDFFLCSKGSNDPSKLENAR